MKHKFTRKLTFLLFIGLFSFHLSGCDDLRESDNASQSEYMISMDVHGEQRSALIVHPTSQEKPAPVLLFFHGNGGNAQSTKNATKLHEAWSEAIVVYAEGTQVDSNGEPTTNSWNNGWTLRFPYKYKEGRGQTKDISYIKLVISSVQSNHSIDPSRIFAAGHSSGSFFTLSLMEIYPELFSGFAVVGAYSRYKVGTLDSNNNQDLQCIEHNEPYSGTCLPQVPTVVDNRCACLRVPNSEEDRAKHPKPVLYVFGKTDMAFNADGPDQRPGWSNDPIVNSRSKSTLQQLLFRNYSEIPDDDYWLDDNRRTFVSSTPEGAEVQWQLYNGGHSWTTQSTNWVVDYFKNL